MFHDLRFKPCRDGEFCFFGLNGSGRDVERQYGVEHISMIGFFGVCIGYAALMGIIGFVALVKQFRVQLRRKASHPPHPEAGAAYNTLGVRMRELSRAPAGEQKRAGAAPGEADKGPRGSLAMRVLRRGRAAAT